MIILKKVDAIDVLNDLAEENSSLADLLYEIEERGKEDALESSKTGRIKPGYPSA